MMVQCKRKELIYCIVISYLVTFRVKWDGKQTGEVSKEVCVT